MSMKNKIHPTAIIYDNVTIGKNVYIGPYSIIGAPAEMEEYFFDQEGKGVMICDNTVITGHCTIDEGFKEQTIIGKDCFLMKHTHIGHDSILDNNVTISAGAIIAGHVRLCQYSTVGINASVHQMTTIAPGTMIGMGSVVTKNHRTGPFDTMFGAPAKRIGTNKFLKNKLTKDQIESMTSEFLES